MNTNHLKQWSAPNSLHAIHSLKCVPALEKNNKLINKVQLCDLHGSQCFRYFLDYSSPNWLVSYTICKSSLQEKFPNSFCHLKRSFNILIKLHDSTGKLCFKALSEPTGSFRSVVCAGLKATLISWCWCWWGNFYSYIFTIEKQSYICQSHQCKHGRKNTTSLYVGISYNIAPFICRDAISTDHYNFQIVIERGNNNRTADHLLKIAECQGPEDIPVSHYGFLGFQNNRLHFSSTVICFYFFKMNISFLRALEKDQLLIFVSARTSSVA